MRVININDEISVRNFHRNIKNLVGTVCIDSKSLVNFFSRLVAKDVTMSPHGETAIALLGSST